MNKFLKFILIGCLFAIVVELQFNFVTGNVGNFIFTLIAYPIFLTFVYFSSKAIDIIKKKWVADTIFLLFFGFLGLAIEWFVIGNSPWGNPDAIQIAMFAHWATLAFMPRIFTTDVKKHLKIKKLIKYYFAIYLIISLPATFLTPAPYNLAVTVLIMSFFYVLMMGFYVWFILQRRKEK